MNSVKMNLVALLVSVVFLGCSGLGQVKDSPENKIQGQWRIFSRELPTMKACEENISNEEACKDLWYKYSVFDECSYLLFNNQNELVKYSGNLKQKELGKTKYSVKEKAFLIRDGEKLYIEF